MSRTRDESEANRVDMVSARSEIFVAFSFSHPVTSPVLSRPSRVEGFQKV